MLWFAAALCLGIAAFVAVSAEERRVRLWFLALGVSCATVCCGLWVETHLERWALLAARVNMTAALTAAMCGLVSVTVICRVPVDRRILALFGVAVGINVITVWLTDAYFTGALYRYGWGLYVGGNPRFLVNPLLSTVIVLSALAYLVRHLRRAHPLDKNRAKYLFVAYAFLSASVLDYLPHFGIDWFSGSVSALTMPAFALIFGYASLRYRLIGFRDAVGRVTGWLATLLLVAAAYVLCLELDRRFLHLGTDGAHVGAAAVTLALFGTLGLRLPRWLERLVGGRGVDFHAAIEGFSGELLGTFDEAQLRARVVEICGTTFDSDTAAVLEAKVVADDPVLPRALDGAPLVESEPLRRAGHSSPLVESYEVLVPLRSEGLLVGAVGLGRRRDRGMYSAAALGSLRALGNLFSIALANARHAVELQSRQRLDRYLPPQVVQSVLGGQHEAIESKRRMTVTLFFSDLQGFTEIAERLPPDVLATVLNEYLSEMADVAFRHGGTLDKFIGDAVMVFFGAPVPSEAADHARCCVEMAIEMQRRLRALNTGWRERGLLDADLVARMGVHTGEATIGSFGSTNRLEYTAIGRAVNLASRLEGKDTPGCILVSRDTWALVQQRFQSTPRGAVTVKGFAQPVEVFEIDPAAPTYRTLRLSSPGV
jgi:class 3 adenylate cyclase